MIKMFAASLTTSQLIELLTYVSFLLVVVGLMISGWQIRQNREHAIRFKLLGEAADDTLERLESVSEALPTRVMGEWPGYLDELATFVTRTERYLKIVRDVPSYGIFSNLDGHHSYLTALEDTLVRGIDVSIIFMSPPARRKLNEQFASQAARSWSRDFETKVHEWLDRLRKTDPLAKTPHRFDEYLDLLEYTNQAAIGRLESAAQVGGARAARKLLTYREANGMVPLYIWVRDGVEAIFAVAVFSPDGEKEIAFITSDLGLVKALEAAFDRYSEENGSCGPDLAPTWP